MSLWILFAKRFVAGENLDDAIKVALALKKLRISASLAHLGEHSPSKIDVKENVQEYILLIKKIKMHKLDSMISIKLSSLGIDIDFDICCENLKNILEIAKKNKVTVAIDMESSNTTEATLGIFRKFSAIYPGIELAIQANLKRTRKDLAKIPRYSRIRLVKGAYKENNLIAFRNRSEVNENYIYLLKTLVKMKCFVCVATHDAKMIELTKHLVNEGKLTKYEIQFLYGIRRDLQKKLASEKMPVRVYIPYGKKWFPYFYRRLRERKENILFVLKHIIR